MLNMQLSAEGAEKLKKREAPNGVAVLTVYADPEAGGLPTGGYGHTGNDIQIGKTYPLNFWEQKFKEDTAWAVAAANKAITNTAITQNQFDAFVSALYNCGPGAKGVRSGLIVLKNGNPSKVLSLINSNQMDKVGPALMEWVHDAKYPAGGPGSPGLINRRASEVGQWAAGAYVAGSGPSATQGSDIQPPQQWNVSALKRLGTAGAGALAAGLDKLRNVSSDDVKSAADQATSATAHWPSFGTIAIILTIAAIVWTVFANKKK